MGMDQLCQPAVLHDKDLVPSLWLAAFAALIGTSLTNEHNALLQHPLIPPQFPSRVIAPLLAGNVDTVTDYVTEILACAGPSWAVKNRRPRKSGSQSPPEDASIRELPRTTLDKNPYEEGCYTGEDLEDVKRKWEAKKQYFLQYKKDGSHPPCIDLAMALQGFDIDNTAAYHAIEDSKALHARRWQTKEGIYRIKRQALPDVRDAPLNDDNAAASSTDVKPRWRNWDEDYAKGYCLYLTPYCIGIYIPPLASV